LDYKYINTTIRYQKGLILNDIFTVNIGICACGCEKELNKRQRKWASEICRTNAYIQFSIIKGDNVIIRQEVYKRDQGFCYNCGVFDEEWQVDHINPVIKGGSACTLENLQTLCLNCHKDKNHTVSHRKAISSQADSICLIRDLYGVSPTFPTKSTLRD